MFHGFGAIFETRPQDASCALSRLERRRTSKLRSSWISISEDLGFLYVHHTFQICGYIMNIAMISPLYDIIWYYMILYDIESCPPFVHLSDLSQSPRICGYRIPDPEKRLDMGFQYPRKQMKSVVSLEERRQIQQSSTMPHSSTLWICTNLRTSSSESIQIQRR